jgi:hypothetical protein
MCMLLIRWAPNKYESPDTDTQMGLHVYNNSRSPKLIEVRCFFLRLQKFATNLGLGTLLFSVFFQGEYSVRIYIVILDPLIEIWMILIFFAFICAIMLIKTSLTQWLRSKTNWPK